MLVIRHKFVQRSWWALWKMFTVQRCPCSDPPTLIPTIKIYCRDFSKVWNSAVLTCSNAFKIFRRNNKQCRLFWSGSALFVHTPVLLITYLGPLWQFFPQSYLQKPFSEVNRLIKLFYIHTCVCCQLHIGVCTPSVELLSINIKTINFYHMTSHLRV